MTSKTRQLPSERTEPTLAVQHADSENVDTSETARKRDATIRSIVSSQSLEGVEISYEEVARIVDRVADESLANIG